MASIAEVDQLYAVCLHYHAREATNLGEDDPVTQSHALSNERLRDSEKRLAPYTNKAV
jgi:hypothetical protein